MTAEHIKAMEDALRDLMAAYEACNGCDHPAYEAAERALAASQTAPGCHQPDLVTAARVRVNADSQSDYKVIE